MGSRIHIIIPFMILFVALSVRVIFPRYIEEFQFKSFDLYQRIQPRIYVDSPVRFVDIDDQTLAKYGQWPWPRTLVAALLQHIGDAGAAAIALDIVFAEPDRTSPANILPLWPATPLTRELQARQSTLPDHDEILADTITQLNVSTGFALSNDGNGVIPKIKAGMAETGDPPQQFLTSFNGAVVTLAALSEAASGNGSINVSPDRDGIVRRVPLILGLGQTIVPSLTAEALRTAQRAGTYVVKASGASGELAFGQDTGINHIKIGAFAVPTDAAGRLWLHFTEPVATRTIPAWRLLEGDFDASALAGQIVILGVSATGLQDRHTTPLDVALPGPLVHVQAIEQILSGHYLAHPDWSLGAELAFILVFGLILSFAIPFRGAVWGALIALIGLTGIVAVSWTAFSSYRLLLDASFPALVVIVIYAVASLMNFMRTELEKRQVRTAFGRYLAPALVEQLAAEPERLVLGGEMREMTLLFADIRGFTTISEQFKDDPQGLTGLINRFLSPMTDMILARHGTVDKYMGDCIMAFWNAPLNDPDHAHHAADAALAMFSALENLNLDIKQEREAAGELFLPLEIGIGLNTGQACVGNMGSTQRFDYSVLGDPVNLASRLEGQSKTYGVGIVIGEDTAAQLPDFATLELDLIAVKGRHGAVRIYTLLGRQELALSAAFGALQTHHEKLVKAYRNQVWDEADILIAECRALDDFLPRPLDGYYDLTAARILQFRADPPGPDWAGIYVATTK